MISWVETPWHASLLPSARRSPSTTVPIADAPGDVRLRVEEDLRVPHALRGGPGEIGVGEVLEVLLGAQDGHELVVQVQEGLEVLELVRLAQLVGVRVRQRRRRCARRARRPARAPGCLRCGGAVRLWGGTSKHRTAVLHCRFGYRHPQQVVRHGQLPLEAGGPRLPLELVRVGVALAEVREHEMPYARVPGHRAPPDRPSGGRGRRRVRSSSSRNVDSMTSMSQPSASAYTPSHSRVSMTNANRCPRRTSLTSSRRHAAQRALPLDPSDVRPLDAVRGEPLGQHAAAVGLDEPVAVRLDGVGELAGLQRVRRRGRRAPRRRRPAPR